MDAALRCPTSNCGNSSVASLLAEYTEAPASFTMMYCTGSGISLRSCTMICSDSREAVPFPKEINVIWYLDISFLIRPWLPLHDSAEQSGRSQSCQVLFRSDPPQRACIRYGMPDPSRVQPDRRLEVASEAVLSFCRIHGWHRLRLFRTDRFGFRAQWQVQSAGCKHPL